MRCSGIGRRRKGRPLPSLLQHQSSAMSAGEAAWIPAFAGMTMECGVGQIISCLPKVPDGTLSGGIDNRQVIHGTETHSAAPHSLQPRPPDGRHPEEIRRAATTPRHVARPDRHRSSQTQFQLVQLASSGPLARHRPTGVFPPTVRITVSQGFHKPSQCPCCDYTTHKPAWCINAGSCGTADDEIFFWLLRWK